MVLYCRFIVKSVVCLVAHLFYIYTTYLQAAEHHLTQAAVKLVRPMANQAYEKCCTCSALLVHLHALYLQMSDGSQAGLCACDPLLCPPNAYPTAVS